MNLRTAKIELLRLLNDRTPLDQFDVTGMYDFTESIPTQDSLRQAALDWVRERRQQALRHWTTPTQTERLAAETRLQTLAPKWQPGQVAPQLLGITEAAIRAGDRPLVDALMFGPMPGMVFDLTDGTGPHEHEGDRALWKARQWDLRHAAFPPEARVDLDLWRTAEADGAKRLA